MKKIVLLMIVFVVLLLCCSGADQSVVELSAVRWLKDGGK